jgi:hypothetical protein
MLSRWDAFYYEVIARHGYPRQLPVDMHGDVLQNVWAFFPAFPLTAGSIAAVTGLEFVTAALAANIAAGAIAAVCLAFLVRSFADDRTALRTAALWSFLPTAFVLHVPYSEAFYAASAAAFLLALARHRPLAAAMLLLAAGLTRGFALPLSAAALAWLWQNRRGSGASDAPDRSSSPVAPVALLAAALVAPVLWMGIAAVRTGRLDAYAATQRAWDYGFAPGPWLEGWRAMAERLGADPVATAVTLVLAAAAMLLVAGLRYRQLPLPLRAHLLCGVLLLFPMAMPGAVAFGSVPRFALSVITLPIVLALTLRTRWLTLAVVFVFLWLQYVWVLNIWSGRLGVAP